MHPAGGSRRRRTAVFGVALVMGLWMSALPATAVGQGFTCHEWRDFQHNPWPAHLRVAIDSGNFPSATLTPSGLRRAAIAAMYRWNELGGGRAFHHVSTRHFGSGSFLEDWRSKCDQDPGYEVIVYANPDHSSGTHPWPNSADITRRCTGEGQYPRAEIRLNAHGPGSQVYTNMPRFVGRPPAGCTNQNPQPKDAVSSLAHEFGHALNIGHPSDGVRATMRGGGRCTRRKRLQYSYDLYCAEDAYSRADSAEFRANRAQMVGQTFSYTDLSLSSTGSPADVFQPVLGVNSNSSGFMSALRPLMGLWPTHRLRYQHGTSYWSSTWTEATGDPTSDTGFEQYHDHGQRRWTFQRSTSNLTSWNQRFDTYYRAVASNGAIGSETLDSFLGCLPEDDPCSFPGTWVRNVHSSYAPSTAYDQYSKTMIRVWTHQDRMDDDLDGRVHVAIIDSDSPSGSPEWNVLRYFRLTEDGDDHEGEPIYSRFGAQVACAPPEELGGFDCIIAWVPISGTSYNLRFYRFWYDRDYDTIIWDEGPVSFGSSVMATPAVWWSGGAIFVAYRPSFGSAQANGSRFRVRKIETTDWLTFTTSYLNQNWSFVTDIPMVIDRLRAVQHRTQSQVSFSYMSSTTYQP